MYSDVNILFIACYTYEFEYLYEEVTLSLAIFYAIAFPSLLSLYILFLSLLYFVTYLMLGSQISGFPL